MTWVFFSCQILKNLKEIKLNQYISWDLVGFSTSVRGMVSNSESSTKSPTSYLSWVRFYKGDCLIDSCHRVALSTGCFPLIGDESMKNIFKGFFYFFNGVPLRQSEVSSPNRITYFQHLCPGLCTRIPPVAFLHVNVNMNFNNFFTNTEILNEYIYYFLTFFTHTRPKGTSK